MTAEKNPEARATQHFDAPAERVFDAWTTPAMVEKWFAPGMGEMVRVEVDARVGGSFSFVQRRGETDFDHRGEYLEFARPRRLAFTWSVPVHNADVSRIEVDIVPKEDGCDLTLTHHLHPSWVDFKSNAEESWAMMLGTMARTIRDG